MLCYLINLLWWRVMLDHSFSLLCFLKIKLDIISCHHICLFVYFTLFSIVSFSFDLFYLFCFILFHLFSCLFSCLTTTTRHHHPFHKVWGSQETERAKDKDMNRKEYRALNFALLNLSLSLAKVVTLKIVHKQKLMATQFVGHQRGWRERER